MPFAYLAVVAFLAVFIAIKSYKNISDERKTTLYFERQVKGLCRIIACKALCLVCVNLRFEFLAFVGLAVALNFNDLATLINDNAIFRLAKLPLMTTKHNIST